MPNQAYDPLRSDTRTFGNLVGRILTELHRPDLQSQAVHFAKDSIRWWQRKPFFFSEIDNTDITTWAPSLFVPYGYTIRDQADDGNFYIFVNLVSGLNGTNKPTFDHRLFVPSGTGHIFAVGQAGTTVDNAITWATVQAWPDTMGNASNLWTTLSTVPRTNQIVPPIDYLGPTTVEITCAGYRYELSKTGYRDLRKLDVIRPAPVTTYPTDYAFYQSLIYLWPYPLSFYPITLSYYSAPFAPLGMGESTFWTTTAEALIRAWAKHLIQAQVIYDPEAAQMEEQNAMREWEGLQDQEREAQAQEGTVPSEW